MNHSHTWSPIWSVVFFFVRLFFLWWPVWRALVTMVICDVEMFDPQYDLPPLPFVSPSVWFPSFCVPPLLPLGKSRQWDHWLQGPSSHPQSQGHLWHRASRHDILRVSALHLLYPGETGQTQPWRGNTELLSSNHAVLKQLNTLIFLGGEL